MGRPLLSSYRYTPIAPVAPVDAAVEEESHEEMKPTQLAVQPAAPHPQPARTVPNATVPNPPKYEEPVDLPQYDDVTNGGEGFVSVVRIMRDEEMQMPVGNWCTFWVHAMLVFFFSILGFLFSICVGVPSHARRLGRMYGVGLDLLKTALWLRYYNGIMCWLERENIPGFPGGHGQARDADGNPIDHYETRIEPEHKYEMVNVKGNEVINFCSLPPVSSEKVFIPIMILFGCLIMISVSAQWHRIVTQKSTSIVHA